MIHRKTVQAALRRFNDLVQLFDSEGVQSDPRTVMCDYLGFTPEGVAGVQEYIAAMDEAEDRGTFMSGLICGAMLLKEDETTV